ncbi:MAG: S1C family serine protease [Candidatus Dependentiae bacterium]
MENIKKSPVVGLTHLLLLSLSVLGFVIYRLSNEQKNLYEMIDSLKMDQSQLATSIVTPQPVIERVVGKSELWRPIQDKVRDTVVQVFAQNAEIDILQPYKTPNQFSSSGSAFFIDEQHLVTNAHVIHQAKAVWIQIPSLGKRIIDAEIVGMSPDRDLALLRLSEQNIQTIKQVLGKVPYLALGDSDKVRRSDEVLALGYPLGQQALKSTTGVISGREQHMLQSSAPINPGSSGGPLLNAQGEVVGINSSGFTEAQNVGYAIPINDLKIVLDDLKKVRLLRKPFLGIIYHNGSDSLTEMLSNPQPGGCPVAEVIRNSVLYKAGVRPGDMIYEINGHRIDIYGEMNVPWSEDKISIIDFVSRLRVGEKIKVVYYRKGARKEANFNLTLSELPPVRKVFPGFEEIDYEVGFGMVVMELTLNHIHALAQNAPGLAKYAELKNQGETSLVVTHIFPSSQLYRLRTMTVGSTINEVNGIKVTNLEQYRQAIKTTVGKKFLTLKVSDNMLRTSDNIPVALPVNLLIQEEAQLAMDYRYPVSSTIKSVLQQHPKLKPMVNPFAVS